MSVVYIPTTDKILIITSHRLQTAIIKILTTDKNLFICDVINVTLIQYRIIKNVLVYSAFTSFIDKITNSTTLFVSYVTALPRSDLIVIACFATRELSVWWIVIGSLIVGCHGDAHVLSLPLRFCPGGLFARSTMF